MIVPLLWWNKLPDLKEFSSLYKIKNVPGDGDCFFHTLVTGLKKSENPKFRKLTVKKLREKVTDYILEKDLSKYKKELNIFYNNISWSPSNLKSLLRRFFKNKLDTETIDIMYIYIRGRRMKCWTTTDIIGYVTESLDICIAYHNYKRWYYFGKKKRCKEMLMMKINKSEDHFQPVFFNFKTSSYHKFVSNKKPASFNSLLIETKNDLKPIMIDENKNKPKVKALSDIMLLGKISRPNKTHTKRILITGSNFVSKINSQAKNTIIIKNTPVKHGDTVIINNL